MSGFKGTEDLSDDKLLDGPFTSDSIRTKTISSAPFYGSENPASLSDEANISFLGSEHWSEAIVRHMPLILRHSSAMVGLIANVLITHINCLSKYFWVLVNYMAE